jgi:predicted O-linked N-acetylglucosamine transferase (SPINDLY family)
MADSPPVNVLPAMSAGHVTFASFHTMAKLNDPLLERWAHILLEVPGSRLLMARKGLDEESQQKRLRDFFGGKGIGAGRLTFKGRQPLADYLALHHEVDVLLDSHPFSGHTVSCHALWMGVPVVTLAGRTHCARMVTSVLSTLGLPEWIAQTPEEFVKIACEQAGDLPRLAELRASLRPRMAASPLVDAPRFARNIEATYREMWRKWCERV